MYPFAKFKFYQVNTPRKAISLALSFGLIPFMFGCSTSTTTKVVERDPCEADASEVILKAKVISEGSKETLRGIRYHTKRKVVLMPVTSASGSAASPYGVPIPGAGADLSGFATEIMNQSFRNEGIKTVAWFKVSKKLKELLASQNNSQQQMMMNMYRQQGSIVNDENLNEVIQVAKDFSACYVVRPVILKSSNTSNTKTSYNPVGLALGFGGLAGSTKTTSNAEIDLKIDIISTREEDIIASKTFSGRSALVSKDRANVLDGITGSSIFSGGSQTDQTRIAFYDTIDKIVEFLEDKML